MSNEFSRFWKFLSAILSMSVNFRFPFHCKLNMNRQVSFALQPNDWDSMLKASSGDVRRLDYVNRFSSIPVSFSENVSAHSFWVTLYSMMINNRVFGISGHKVDQIIELKILKKALSHDMVECVTGDFVRTFKYSSESLTHAIDKAETEVVQSIHSEIRDIIEGGSISENDPDREYIGGVVKAADFLSLHQFLRREVMRGNKEINPFVIRYKADLLLMSNKQKLKSSWFNESFANFYLCMLDDVNRGFSDCIVVT